MQIRTGVKPTLQHASASSCGSLEYPSPVPRHRASSENERFTRRGCGWFQQSTHSGSCGPNGLVSSSLGCFCGLLSKCHFVLTTSWLGHDNELEGGTYRYVSAVAAQKRVWVGQSRPYQLCAGSVSTRSNLHPRRTQQARAGLVGWRIWAELECYWRKTAPRQVRSRHCDPGQWYLRGKSVFKSAGKLPEDYFCRGTFCIQLTEPFLCHLF